MVITFPLFEDYNDRIIEWISTIDRQRKSRRATALLINTMRGAAAQMEKVRGCERYVNLATFVRHAANAPEASETDGARYLLMTSLALTAPLPSERKADAVVHQFPAPRVATTVPLMGMVTG
jgi:hypothetical protein